MNDDVLQTKPTDPDPTRGNHSRGADESGHAEDILPEKTVDAHIGGAGEFSRATGRDLERGPDQPQYRRYQYDLIAPHVGRSLLEVGAGIGDFAAQFEGLDRLVISDVDPDAVAVIARRFADRDEVEARVVDVSGPIDPAVLDDDPVATPTGVATVVAINVLEHIEDHVTALRGLASLVEPGGTMVFWVPAYMALYGEFDRLVGHVRRYTPQTLTAAFTEAGLEPVTVRPVNVLGGLAWWLVVRKGGTGAPNPKLVALYNRVVVPLTRIVDRIGIPFGQSVIGVARVPTGPR